MQLATQSPAVSADVAVLRLFFGDDYAREFAIRFWHGVTIPSIGPARFTLVINTPGALRAALSPPFDLSAGRAFAAGFIECEGDIEAAVDALYRAVGTMTPLRMLRLARALHQLPAASFPRLREARLHGVLHSRERDRAAIGFHYDQPPSFYRTFLGDNLVYSCAYYDDGVESLEDAQMAKLDYVLRKMRLARGERLLDIGCGWGSLVVHAARRYGAQVLGITLSPAQHAFASARIEEAGIADLARVELRDYRDLRGERFDKIVSIGMVEHVGRSHLPAYFSAAYEALHPGGLFLNHGIVDQSPGRRGGKASGFMERFVFPDGELVALSDMLHDAERVGFEIRDVENLREHYMRTLRAWVQNIETHRDQAVAAAGEESYRTWRLYMAGSAQGFRCGRIGIAQSLLARPCDDGRVSIPATRRDLYASIE